ncbi:bifunctional 2-polyprenyl-6-hydroxyphenol methylase/3-demethylubiquinol 3-O-methyltransferase UbiG [Nereida sp. MMG025]|uniref:class I SAM-dependent methyltransferase n=1 Tax=Nereida sp. MMG025 TaxID=2909981 RepID=UPI001F45A303|nr:class I SAM-dependent methyltransferase [Nereida sp. MMG025]MCF6444740.1 class I SAM-dependent methyltransferase [Nereida sp. MMG025]
MTKNKLDTRSIGLDVGVKLMQWLTGTENLHYGLWTGIDVNAGNVGRAQTAYTDKLFERLPKGKLRILDIGGGAGVTAGKLLALGHSVEIVVPSEVLAERCRANAVGATVYVMGFEDFQSDHTFDLCLFSESFQYIDMGVSLPKCVSMLGQNGQILIADCFRSDAFVHEDLNPKVGGGHPLSDFDQIIEKLGLTEEGREDITEAVAPSVDIEQELFNVLGFGLTRIGAELQAKKPRARWILDKVIGLVMNERKRKRLDLRLNGNLRTAEVFCHNNRYIITVLKP